MHFFSEYYRKRTESRSRLHSLKRRTVSDHRDIPWMARSYDLSIKSIAKFPEAATVVLRTTRYTRWREEAEKKRQRNRSGAISQILFASRYLVRTTDRIRVDGSARGDGLGKSGREGGTETSRGAWSTRRAAIAGAGAGGQASTSSSTV